MTTTLSKPVKRTLRAHIHRMGSTVARVEDVDDAPSLIRVFEVIRAMHDGGIAPTRELIIQRSCLKPTTVDECIKVLRAEGLLSREPQSYWPTTIHAPARAVSITFLPNGMCKLEIGDLVLELTPDEARTIGLSLQGMALEAVALVRQNMLYESMQSMQKGQMSMRRQIEALKAEASQRNIIDSNAAAGLKLTEACSTAL